jgi:hypothetical protein
MILAETQPKACRRLTESLYCSFCCSWGLGLIHSVAECKSLTSEYPLAIDELLGRTLDWKGRQIHSVQG